jgi:hypothetical protein
VAVLTIFLMGIVYCLAVPGSPRSYTKAGVAAVVAVFTLARLYLGVDHPGDVLLGATFAVAIAVTAFRFFTPNEVFPVAYRRGRTAHVDVTGRRGEAIRQGLRDQLGLTVTEIKPVGLESSAGSTPLRLRVDGGPEQFLFAKLYTKGHVRADRWYKLGRTILYGSLEDESARLVEGHALGAGRRSLPIPCIPRRALPIGHRRGGRPGHVHRGHAKPHIRRPGQQPKHRPRERITVSLSLASPQIPSKVPQAISGEVHTCRNPCAAHLRSEPTCRRAGRYQRARVAPK